MPGVCSSSFVFRVKAFVVVTLLIISVFPPFSEADLSEQCRAQSESIRSSIGGFLGGSLPAPDPQACVQTFEDSAISIECTFEAEGFATRCADVSGIYLTHRAFLDCTREARTRQTVNLEGCAGQSCTRSETEDELASNGEKLKQDLEAEGFTCNAVTWELLTFDDSGMPPVAPSTPPPTTPSISPGGGSSPMPTPPPSISPGGGSSPMPTPPPPPPTTEPPTPTPGPSAASGKAIGTVCVFMIAALLGTFTLK